MNVMVSRKVNRVGNVLIERVLPAEGEINARVGDLVEPFTKLGVAKVSYGQYEIDSKLKVVKGKGVGGYFYIGDTVGRVGRNVVTAPFDGYLERTKTGLLLRQENRDYWLLSGVWGEVKDVVGKNSVLIDNKMMNVIFAACTNVSYAGELVVFPNPSELLEMQYLEKFEKETFGKIIYIGDFANSEVISRAVELGVGGVLAGSADRSTFSVAKSSGMFLGVFNGFGHIPTPEYIFNELKEISNRYVFLQGERGLLRVPLPRESEIDEKLCEIFRKVEEGLRIQLLDKSNFGLVGIVDSIQGEDLYVILDGSKKSVKVQIANVLSLE